jgi:hypothetical protein
MTYIPAQDSSDGFAKVIYQSKDGNTSKTFDALDRLVPPSAGLTSHIPNKGESRFGGGSLFMNQAFTKKFFDRLGPMSLLDTVLKFQFNSLTAVYGTACTVVWKDEGCELSSDLMQCENWMTFRRIFRGP